MEENRMAKYYTQVAAIDRMAKDCVVQVDQLTSRQAKVAAFLVFNQPITTMNTITELLHKILPGEEYGNVWNELVDYETVKYE
jgi:hypothetical protein